MALLVVGSLCVVIAVDSLLTERSLTSSRDAASSGDLTRAGEDARDAIALQPWAAAPRLQLALVQETAGDPQAADTTIKEAISRAPDDWELWLARTRIALLSSDLREARAPFERARSLNPRDPVFTALTGPLQQ
jgi:Tfp pilus assembly protein PilF